MATALGARSAAALNYADHLTMVVVQLSGLALGGALGNRWGMTRNVKKMLLAVQGAVMIYSLFFPLVFKDNYPSSWGGIPLFCVAGRGHNWDGLPTGGQTCKGNARPGSGHAVWG
jgi:hypothetical protein